MLDEFKSAITSNPQLKVKTLPQAEFLAEQRACCIVYRANRRVHRGHDGVGALFGALNTMYNAVAAHAGDCDVACAGFRARAPVILSVMFESLALALIGGAWGRRRHIWRSTVSRLRR